MKLLVFLLLALAAAPLPAQAPENPILVVEHWSERAPLISGVDGPLTREVVLERLVTEAQIILSGMIYGFSFSYTPSNPDRSIPEQFQMEPFGTVPRGDPGFEVFQTWTEGDRLYARILYTMTDEQLQWFNGWQSSANASSSGVGTVPFVRGPVAKIDALQDGVRSAVREYLREQVRNRPREATGAVLLRESPRFGVNAGDYTARVDVLVQIDSVEPYRVY